MLGLQTIVYGCICSCVLCLSFKGPGESDIEVLPPNNVSTNNSKYAHIYDCM